MSMTLVETVDIGAGGAASIEFTSIPQDGVDLLLLISARNRTSLGITFQDVDVRPNSSTSFVFTQILLDGDGSSATSSSSNGNRRLFEIPAEDNSTPEAFSNTSIYISNYTASQNKSFNVDSIAENNAVLAIQEIRAALHPDTSAITSLELVVGNEFAEHSTASLYKIT